MIRTSADKLARYGRLYHDAPGSGALVVTVTGRQSIGALADVMKVLGGDSTYRLMDFAQIVMRNRFTAIAVLASETGTSSTSSDTVKDIIFRAHAAGFQIDFDASCGTLSMSSASSGSLSSLAMTDGPLKEDEYIVTMFAPVRVPAQFISDATRIMADHSANIMSINRLTEEDDAYMCIELVLRLNPASGNFGALRRKLFQLGRTQNSPDIAMQQAQVTRTAKRIVAFDLSWTLVQCDAIDILLDSAGVQVTKEDREAYKDGQLSGPDWVRKRITALKGLDADKMNALAVESLTYTDGAKNLCKGLKRLGCRLAVISSGSKLIADQAKEHLGLHFAYGNIFETDSRGKFTGSVRVCTGLFGLSKTAFVTEASL